jgi:hypothetical protein
MRSGPCIGHLTEAETDRNSQSSVPGRVTRMLMEFAVNCIPSLRVRQQLRYAIPCCWHSSHSHIEITGDWHKRRMATCGPVEHKNRNYPKSVTTVAEQDSHERIKRSAAALTAFMKQTGYRRGRSGDIGAPTGRSLRLGGDFSSLEYAVKARNPVLVAQKRTRRILLCVFCILLCFLCSPKLQL